MKTLLLLLSIACAALAQPTVSGVVNNYSYIAPGLPNYGIAQGSIFVLFGANLSAATTPLQNAPLPTTLQGVSVSVTVSGQTRAALLYYVSPTQIAGILPSSTPTGTGTLTVTSNGRSSAPASLTVVQSSFGTLTINGSGSGAAAVFDANNQFLTATNPARPGNVIVLFGTGVGPISGDEANSPTQTNLTSIPLTVEIGGRPAQILYRGRTVFPGLDQINIVVPNNAPASCTTSLVVSSGTAVSNFTTIPIATGSGPCVAEAGDPNLILSSAEIARYIAAGNYTTGSVGLSRSVSYIITDSPTGGAPTSSVIRSDSLTAGFNRVSGNLDPLFNSSFLAPSPGSCIVTTGITNPFPDLVYKGLDAGPSITSSGSPGTRTAPRSTNSVGVIGYSATIGDGTAGNYIDPGTYTLSGSGGPDIGAFSASLTVPPELLWTNRDTLTIVDRTRPITLTWSGGEPTTLVTIQGTSTAIQSGRALSTSFQCWARNTDQSFTIPSSVLLSLLPSPTQVITPTLSLLQRGTLAIATVGRGTRIRPTGLDYGTLGSQIGIAQSTVYR